MRKNLLNLLQRNRRGFTLTEVLLAVMIVGLIGVALAALTRSAAREAGIGRSRIMLRNNLSTFARTLRNDLEQASYIRDIAGELTVSNTDGLVLMKLAGNVEADGTALANETASYVTYCFQRGSVSDGVVPNGAYIGGKIYRLEKDSTYPTCESLSSKDLVLDNVKYIPANNSVNYPVPLFIKSEDDGSLAADKRLPGFLNVKIITELSSTPVVNEVIEEAFFMPVDISEANGD